MPIDLKNWSRIYCENPGCRAFLAWTDAVSVLVGNCLITQPQTALLCPNAGCRRIRKFSSPTNRKIVRVAAPEELAGLGSEYQGREAGGTV